MIFVEFVRSNFLNDAGNTYFVGTNLSDILADTHDGTYFGQERYETYRQISEEETSSLGLEYFNTGKAAVLKGSKSYYLGSPRQVRLGFR